jgi:hypothetical protein
MFVLYDSIWKQSLLMLKANVLASLNRKPCNHGFYHRDFSYKLTHFVAIEYLQHGVDEWKVKVSYVPCWITYIFLWGNFLYILLQMKLSFT